MGIAGINEAVEDFHFPFGIALDDLPPMSDPCLQRLFDSTHWRMILIENRNFKTIVEAPKSFGRSWARDKIAKVYPIASPSAEHQMRERLKNGVTGLRKLLKGLSLFTGLLDHLNIERFEDVPSEDLPNVVGLFEDVYRSANANRNNTGDLLRS